MDLEKFKGRKKKIEEAERYFNGVMKGNSKHIFVAGQRGLGKSSFARYLSKIVTKKYNMYHSFIFRGNFQDQSSYQNYY